MPPRKTARNGGCWTCKLRRKKCDETHPRCSDCTYLTISCEYGPKPAWMDGGARQKQRAVSIKTEIRRSIAHRRERAHVRKESSTEAASRNYDIISDMTIIHGLSTPQPTAATEPQNPPSHPEGQNTSVDGPTILAKLPWSHHQHQRSDTLEQASPTEWAFIMKYLDFVFPALFPFYQPHIFDAGRSWLLILLKKSKIAYHAALGLSCYYFTMALSDAGDIWELAACKQLRWKEVEQESEKCFASLRAEIVAITASIANAPTPILDKVELMNSITQVIVFEMTMGKAAPWNTHLPAAMSLFEDIMSHPGSVPIYRGRLQNKFASVLLGLGEPSWTNPWPSNHIWSPIQAGFRFYAGLLIFVDIIASTATGQMPRLQSYHEDILATNDEAVSLAGEAKVRLSNIVGCPNWVASSIASISALTAREQTQTIPSDSCASRVGIIGRYAGIKQELDEGIAALKAGPTASTSPDANKNGSSDLIPLASDPKSSNSSSF